MDGNVIQPEEIENVKPEYLVQFEKEQHYIMERYNVRETHAGCYLVNFGDMQFCDDCVRYAECAMIKSGEEN